MSERIIKAAKLENKPFMIDRKTIKTIDGQDWFCCPICGKKLLHVNDGAVCRGVSVKCKGKTSDGQKCTWAGEIRIF